MALGQRDLTLSIILHCLLMRLRFALFKVESNTTSHNPKNVIMSKDRGSGMLPMDPFTIIFQYMVVLSIFKF